MRLFLVILFVWLSLSASLSAQERNHIRICNWTGGYVKVAFHSDVIELQVPIVGVLAGRNPSALKSFGEVSIGWEYLDMRYRHKYQDLGVIPRCKNFPVEIKSLRFLPLYVFGFLDNNGLAPRLDDYKAIRYRCINLRQNFLYVEKIDKTWEVFIAGIKTALDAVGLLKSECGPYPRHLAPFSPIYPDRDGNYHWDIFTCDVERFGELVYNGTPIVADRLCGADQD